MPMPGFGPGGGLFSIVPTIMLLFFAVVICIILFQVLRGLSEWKSNNQQPVNTEAVVVKDKRTHVSGHGRMGNNMHHGHTRTTYYVTFEFEDGERQEFKVKGQDYGHIAQGDQGQLTYQGTRFHQFERTV